MPSRTESRAPACTSHVRLFLLWTILRIFLRSSQFSLHVALSPTLALLIKMYVRRNCARTKSNSSKIDRNNKSVGFSATRARFHLYNYTCVLLVLLQGSSPKGFSGDASNDEKRGERKIHNKISSRFNDSDLRVFHCLKDFPAFLLGSVCGEKVFRLQCVIKRSFKAP